MPQAGTKSRAIWRHPRGRFDVVEYRGTSPLGPPYRIREAVLTPERDERGQINETVNNKVFNSGTNKSWDPPKPIKAHREYKPITAHEGVMIMDMYREGWPVSKIAQAVHRDRTKVSEYITMQQ